MDFIKKHKIEIGVVLVALVLRCIYFGLSFNTYGGGDLNTIIEGADGYFVVAQNIIAGHGFSDSSGAPYSFRPPLYHYFLAVNYFLFGGFGGVVALQIIIGGLLPLLGMALAKRLSFSRNIYIWTGILLAIEPFSILYSIFFYSETVFMLLFFISLLYLFDYLKDKKVLHLIFSACFLAFAALTRPVVEYLPILIIAAILWEWRKNISI